MSCIEQKVIVQPAKIEIKAYPYTDPATFRKTHRVDFAIEAAGPCYVAVSFLGDDPALVSCVVVEKGGEEE